MNQMTFQMSWQMFNFTFSSSCLRHMRVVKMNLLNEPGLAFNLVYLDKKNFEKE